uniref:Uncharacterized protein n=1 Tax=Cryptomonas curvata TaxID=233186 RepID=A0A7S0QLX8_9CRYP
MHDGLGGRACRFEPGLVFPGAVVYVNAFLLRDFMENKHPFIQHPYVLLTHCSDASAPGPYEHVLDDPRLLAWFAQNADLSFHAKLHPIPIGLANPGFPHGNVSAVTAARAALPPDTWWSGPAGPAGPARPPRPPRRH